MTERCTILSIGAAAIVGLANTLYHSLKTRFEMILRERRALRSTIRVNSASASAAPSCLTDAGAASLGSPY